MDQNEQEEIEYFGDDPTIASYNAKVPKFLIYTYVFLPIWGIIVLFIFWNGSLGWFDRGYWHELQVAANTTFPRKQPIKEEIVEEKSNR